MKKMLLRDPAQRFSSNQCLNHHWFIKMKSKDETKPRNNYITKQRSLSTIIENSEIMELTQRYEILAKVASSAQPEIRASTRWRPKNRFNPGTR